MLIRVVVTVCVLFALAGIGACGSSGGQSTTSSTSPSQTASSTSSTPTAGARGALQVAANPNGVPLFYNPKRLTAKAGTVTIDFTNHSHLPHNVTIATSIGKVLGATPTFHGGSRVLSLDLRPGTYMFYCSVPGHRAAGMQGELVVR